MPSSLDRFGQPFVRVITQGEGDLLLFDPTLIDAGQQRIYGGESPDEVAAELAMTAVLEGTIDASTQALPIKPLKTLAEELPPGPFRTGFNRGALLLNRAMLLVFKAAEAAIPAEIDALTAPTVIERVGKAVEAAVRALLPAPLAAVFLNGGIVGAYSLTKTLRGLEFNPNQPRDEKGMWTDTGEAYIADATSAGDEPPPNWHAVPTAPPKKGSTLIVFRLEYAKNAGLAGKNAGNAEAIAAHLLNHEEYGDTDIGSILTAYEVTLTEDMTDKYVSMAGGEAKPGESEAPEHAVGRGSYFFGRGYVFPASGKGYTAKPLSSIPASEVAGKYPGEIAKLIRQKFPRQRQLEAFRTLWPDKTGHDDHGRPHEHNHQGRPQGLIPGSPAWMASIKQVGGKLGSNEGGVYVDAAGQKWYVKKYKDPAQAMSEQVSNTIYNALGAQTPETYLGEGGVFASKWAEAGPTLAKAGLSKETANKILNHFAVDVLVANWDTVGTGHDNIFVGPKGIVRIDQGGTLLHRAQGALKPESGLFGISEWESIPSPSTNIWYAKVFKAAGLKSADELGSRAIDQITAIERVRNSAGGWEAFIRKAAPAASPAFVAKAASILEARTKALITKREALRNRTLEMRSLDTKKKPSRNVGTIKIIFKDGNELAADWAGEHAAELAKNLSEVTKKRIKDALAASFVAGSTVDFPKVVRAAVNDKKRAEVIAHHESMVAMSEGQRASWEQATKKGLLGPDAKRIWITTIGACEICEALAGMTALIGQPYGYDGGDGPPRHVNCRCTEGITFE